MNRYTSKSETKENNWYVIMSSLHFITLAIKFMSVPCPSRWLSSPTKASSLAMSHNSPQLQWVQASASVDQDNKQSIIQSSWYIKTQQYLQLAKLPCWASDHSHLRNSIHSWYGVIFLFDKNNFTLDISFCAIHHHVNITFGVSTWV